MKFVAFLFFFLCWKLNSNAQNNNRNIIQLIFTSDAHYGIKRKNFRNDTAVDGHIVNAAMINEMNLLPQIRLPLDSGVNAGRLTGPIDYLIQGGDVANRMEIPDQSDAKSWRQFYFDYIKGITLKGPNGKPAKIIIVPGNHDISNAIGFYKPMMPKTDATSMSAIYNLMMQPAKPLTPNDYDYSKDKIHFSKNVNGVHFMFITLWPDSSERIWMEKDLRNVSSKTPVILFTHDQPECEAKHFTNPASGHDINENARFENLVDEVYKEGSTVITGGGKTDMEQNGWVRFLKKHPNIKAYFHGNSNWNQFYSYKGPDSTVSLPVFRVDSPMKGKYSSKDEAKLSFQVLSIDSKTLIMTVRECLWNADAENPDKCLKWGTSKTISLACKETIIK